MDLTELNFCETLSKLNNSCLPQKRTSKDLKNEQSKKSLYEYVGDTSINTNNTKKIYDKIPKSSISTNELKDLKIKYYLIPDISHRSSGEFVIEYNTKIFVKDVLSSIKEQMLYLKNVEKSIYTFEQIIQSEGYKLALVNSFGFFLTFLEEENYELTNILKHDNSLEKLKHLCLYDFKEIKNGTQIKNLIVVHFLKNSVLDLIIKKKDVYENYHLQNINVPVFLINESFLSEGALIGRIRDLYVNYFGKSAEKNVDFKIYIIKNSDILDLKVTKINYLELSKYFELYFGSDTPSIGYGMQKYNTKRLLVGI